ncbi:MAG: hypothetical protein ABR572_09165 [Cryomorphaceae bacterium]|nr:hypothetical protein [Flavobacteriales bacterium]
MKKLIIPMLFLASICASCEKDDFQNEPTSVGDKNNATIEQESGKTAADDFKLMAEASALESITYGNGKYEMSFYNESQVYVVDLVDFNTTKLIEYSITEGSHSRDAKIDVENEEVILHGPEIISFITMEGLTITNSTDIDLRLVALVTVHHSIAPEQNANFDHNTNGGEFPETSERNCFWCNVTTVGPCKFHYQMETVKKYRFGVLFDTVQTQQPC